MTPFIKWELEGALRSHQKDAVPVEIMYKNTAFLPLFYAYSPFLLSINFLIPKQTHATNLEARVFCVLFPVSYCTYILHFSQSTSCFFHYIIQVHVDYASNLFFLIQLSLRGIVYLLQMYAFHTLQKDWLKYNDECEKNSSILLS